jgi:hypothetical protein
MRNPDGEELWIMTEGQYVCLRTVQHGSPECCRATDQKGHDNGDGSRVREQFFLPAVIVKLILRELLHEGAGDGRDIVGHRVIGHRHERWFGSRK